VKENNYCLIYVVTLNLTMVAVAYYQDQSNIIDFIFRMNIVSTY